MRLREKQLISDVSETRQFIMLRKWTSLKMILILIICHSFERALILTSQRGNVGFFVYFSVAPGVLRAARHCYLIHKQVLNWSLFWK